MGDLNSDATGFGVGVGYTAHLDIDHTIFLSQLSFVQYIDLSPFRTQANIMHLHNTRPEIYKITTSKEVRALYMEVFYLNTPFTFVKSTKCDRCITKANLNNSKKKCCKT